MDPFLAPTDEDAYVLCFRMVFNKDLINSVSPNRLLFKLQRNLVCTLDQEVRPFMEKDKLDELDEWVKNTNHQIDMAEAMQDRPARPN